MPIASTPANRSVTAATIAFAAAFTLHGIDHFRRGISASPPSIMVGGMLQGLFVVFAVVLEPASATRCRTIGAGRTKFPLTRIPLRDKGA